MTQEVNFVKNVDISIKFAKLDCFCQNLVKSIDFRPPTSLNSNINCENQNKMIPGKPIFLYVSVGVLLRKE